MKTRSSNNVTKNNVNKIEIIKNNIIKVVYIKNDCLSMKQKQHKGLLTNNKMKNYNNKFTHLYF